MILEGFFGDYHWTGKPLVKTPAVSPFKQRRMVGERFTRLTVIEDLGRRQANKRRVWGCKCDCGALIAVDTSNLEYNHTRSCGCLVREHAKRMGDRSGALRRLDPGRAARNNLMLVYRRGAYDRGHEFTLSDSEFDALTKDDCFYCGVEPRQVNKGLSKSGPYLYNGIDRLDNRKGYIAGNVVSCCGQCNRLKGSMSVDEFVGWLARVSDARIAGKGVWKKGGVK